MKNRTVSFEGKLKKLSLSNTHCKNRVNEKDMTVVSHRFNGINISARTVDLLVLAKLVCKCAKLNNSEVSS